VSPNRDCKLAPASRGSRGEHDQIHDHVAPSHLTYIRTINAALKDRPDGMTITTHMCRGNFRSSWVAQGGYDFVAEPLFGELEVDAFFMEYDDDRSGTFEPLRFVPKGKLVVLGLVTSKNPELESEDELKRRIEEAARFIDIDQLCLSPQCGFPSTKGGQQPHIRRAAGEARTRRRNRRRGLGHRLMPPRPTRRRPSAHAPECRRADACAACWSAGAALLLGAGRPAPSPGAAVPAR
jgi:Cobalamin-independent synthase, Catalytic domain